MKAAIYCRLSDEDKDKLHEQNDSVSIQNQKAMLIKFASDNGWIIYDIYSDDDFAGTDRRRPEFHRLIMDASARKFDIILCKTQSRFTREMELVEKYIHGLFPRLGIRFISLADNADTENIGNKKARQINGFVNEWFLEELSENIKAVLTARREQGYHIGSFAPYGYMKDPDLKGHLLIDPEAAAIVKEIYDLYLQGKGKQVIARTLNDRGVPNPTEYKRQHGMVRNKNGHNSCLWSYCTISNILTNEVYIGNMVQGKSCVRSYKNQTKIRLPPSQWIVVRGTHEPIIDQAIWDKTQAMVAKKATPARNEPEGIFSRKVRCIHCGSRMHAFKKGNKRGYKCNRHVLSYEACSGAYISLPKLERIVVAQLRHLSDELLDRVQLETGIDPFPDLREMKINIEYEIAVLRKSITYGQTAMRTIYLDKVKGIISGDDYTAMLLQISDVKDASEKKIAEYEEQNLQIEKTLAIHSNRHLITEQYVETRHLTREMVDILIDYIQVGKRDPVTKYTTVEIHWNF